MSKILHLFILFIGIIGVSNPSNSNAAAGAAVPGTDDFTFKYDGKLGFRPVKEADADGIHGIFGHPAVMAGVEYSVDSADTRGDFRAEWAGKTTEEWQAYVANNIVKKAEEGDLEPTFLEEITAKLTAEGKTFADDDAAEWLSNNWEEAVAPTLESLRGAFYVNNSDSRFHDVLRSVAFGVFAYPKSRTTARVQTWADRHDSGNPFSLWVACKLEDPNRIVAVGSLAKPNEDGVCNGTFGCRAVDLAGKGIGSDFSKALLAYLSRHSGAEIRQVHSTARADNGASIALHAALGFTHTGDVEEWGSIRHKYALDLTDAEGAEHLAAWVEKLEVVEKKAEAADAGGAKAGEAAEATDEEDDE